jgi:serine/threonine-protein kinase RsbW
MSDSSENSETKTVQKMVFPGEFDSLTEISEFITRFAEAAGLEARDIYAVQLAVDEACSNIIQHAYGGEGEGDIECTCSLDEEGLTVVLRDEGCPFNPDEAPDPDLDADIEDRKIGGLGLYFIKQLMDQVGFEFTPDEGNVLTMVKRKDDAS